MKINWEEQPTPEHVWIEDLMIDPTDGDASGWYKQVVGGWDNDNGIEWNYKYEGKSYKVHHRPEPELKQGDLVDVTWKMPMDDAIGAKIIAIKDDKAWVEHEFLEISEVVLIANLRKHESERDKFISKVIECGFTRQNSDHLWEAGFRYTGDKE